VYTGLINWSRVRVPPSEGYTTTYFNLTISRMAILKSAKKANKRSIVLRARNLDFKLAMKKAIKDLRKAVAEKKDHTTLM